MLTQSVCFVYLLAIGITGAFKVLDLYEGEVCKQERGVQWTCKLLKNCPKTIKEIKNGARPDICSFKGSDVIACCEPDAGTSSPKPDVNPITAPPDKKAEEKFGGGSTAGPVITHPPTSDKSKQMCMKYGKSVFVEIPDPLGEGIQTFDTCAAVEPLIINGVDAEPREYPHMVLVGYGDKDAIEWLCAGSLISERFVLSAAHCTDAGKNGFAKWARLGEYNARTDKDNEMGLAQSVDYEIVEIINHPSYKSSSLYNDLALLRLGQDVEFNEYVRPICLHTEYNIPKPYIIATGWGNTNYRGKGSDVLQKVNLTVTPTKICNEAYKRLSVKNLKDGIVDALMFCAGDILNKKDTCQGDSGGPLQLRLSNPYCMYSQVGITSFGFKCASTAPGVYTRVSAFVPWIESVVWP